MASNDPCRKRCQWGIHDTFDEMNPALFIFTETFEPGQFVMS